MDIERVKEEVRKAPDKGQYPSLNALKIPVFYVNGGAFVSPLDLHSFFKPHLNGSTPEFLAANENGYHAWEAERLCKKYWKKVLTKSEGRVSSEHVQHA